MPLDAARSVQVWDANRPVPNAADSSFLSNVGANALGRKELRQSPAAARMWLLRDFS